MTEIVLNSCEPRTLLSHMALYGLGAILESQGVRDVRLGWTESGNPRPYVSVPEADGLGLAALVGQHAKSLNSEGSWVQRDVIVGGSPRGLMSPRLSTFKEEGKWAEVQQERWTVQDKLTVDHRWFDLRYLAALGEPAYWSLSQKGEPLQDNGASRLEMQPRNTGSEFVGSRLRKVAATVAAREPVRVLSGLRGDSVADEAGSDKLDSRTATGFASPGPTDNALAWCALWGISEFPVAMRVGGTARTSGHLNGGRREWFYAPMWQGLWRPALLRSVLASQFPRVLASSGLGLSHYTETEVSAARAWLRSRHVDGVMRFPVEKFGSDNAPERRAMRGEAVSVQGVA
jgi:CRISPR-associated protein Csb3